MTKTAIQSKELKVIVLTLAAEVLAFLLHNEGFVEISGGYILIFQVMSLSVLGYLRLYKTTKPISGWITKPVSSKKTYPPDRTDPLEAAVEASDEAEEY